MQRTGLTELNAFIEIATHRSFRQAAVKLGMSPSALSHAIRGLEQSLGVRLLNRTTRSVAPSEAGERLLERLRPALRDIADALQEVNEFRSTPAGSIRINCSEAGARILLGPVVGEFLKRYPQVQLDIITEGRPVDIVAEGFDAGVRLFESVPQDMIAVRFGPDLRFAAVASPDYFRGRAKPAVPDDLLEHDCIRFRFPTGQIYRWNFEKGGRPGSVDVKGSLTLDNQQLMVEAALNGMGIAWVLELNVMQHLEEGRLVRVLEDWSPTFAGLCLYYPGHRHVPPALRAFADMLRETVPARRPPLSRQSTGKAA